MGAPVRQFHNPTTGHSYRLVIAEAAWRITKASIVGREDGARLAHLRGTAGQGIADPSAIDALVRGASTRCSPADPVATYAAVVLTDIDRTADLLTAEAREAQTAYEEGRPGFRPGSGVLRERRDQALVAAMAQMLALAREWLGSGLSAPALPVWLAAAIEECGSAETG
jgi:hypothetical protein